MRRAHVIVAVAGSLIAVPATAKEGVRATLDRPVRLGAPAGTSLRVAWHLADEEGHRFGASGIYLRVTRCSGRVVRIAATAHRDGGYSARVRVPKHGIRKLVVGLEGIQIIGDQQQRADVYFAFDPPLRRSCCQE